MSKSKPTQTKVEEVSLESTLENLFRRHQEDNLKNKELATQKTHEITSEEANLNVAESSKAKDNVAKGLKTLTKEEKQQAAGYNIDSTNIPEEFFDDEKFGYNPTTEGAIEPQPPVDCTLPVLVTKELLAADNIDIEWTSVKDLPGFIKRDIRALGRAVFSSFTDTNPDDVVTMACTHRGDSLTGHEMRDLNAVAGWARANSTERPEFAEVINMDFSNFIKQNPRGPVQGNYEPKAKFYETPQISFLLVDDFMGKYIYAWETKAKNKLDKKIQERLDNASSDTQNRKRPRLR